MELYEYWMEPNGSWLHLNGSWMNDENGSWIDDTLSPIWCREQELELELERNRTIWMKDIISGSFVEQSILFPICSFGVLGNNYNDNNNNKK